MAETLAEATADADDGQAILTGTAARGVYLKSSAFQDISDAVERVFEGLLGASDLRWTGASVIALEDLRRSAYVDRFPQLVATVKPLLGEEGGDIGDTAMTPAACLHLYALVARRPAIGPAGLMASTTCACHRTEAAYGPGRMRTFTMAELVFFGRPAQVNAFMEQLGAAVRDWLVTLQLQPSERAANDPFFGRGAELMAQHQRALQTKVEVTLPVGGQSEMACFSFNHHAEFFSQRWEIVLEEGGWAQSACVGVGLERLTLALIDRHGDRPSQWPTPVRRALFGETE